MIGCLLDSVGYLVSIGRHPQCSLQIISQPARFLLFQLCLKFFPFVVEVTMDGHFRFSLVSGRVRGVW